ncbi:hypothetical protein HID58_033734 [Brassica napus]|uniref:Uncharacterized protein n=1 Tax=Brassica napus TaxID=3708 RepID=A0ABQ8C0A8_BRANA|nr:hypothetical protein HID58_033734 [Brassica napus]
MDKWCALGIINCKDPSTTAWIASLTGRPLNVHNSDSLQRLHFDPRSLHSKSLAESTKPSQNALSFSFASATVLKALFTAKIYANTLAQSALACRENLMDQNP